MMSNTNDESKNIIADTVEETTVNTAEAAEALNDNGIASGGTLARDPQVGNVVTNTADEIVANAGTATITADKVVIETPGPVEVSVTDPEEVK